MMWEEGYWEAPANRAQVDALEVYNGQALAAVGIDFEERYREATAYRRARHQDRGDDGRRHARAELGGARAGEAGGVRRRVGQAARACWCRRRASTRPELDAATLVYADGNTTADVIAAVKARRTIATYALPKLTVTLDGLGEVRRTRDVKLAMKLSRKLAEVTLYREGVAVKTWQDVDAAEWQETLRRRRRRTCSRRATARAPDDLGDLVRAAALTRPRRRRPATMDDGPTGLGTPDGNGAF